MKFRVIAVPVGALCLAAALPAAAQTDTGELTVTTEVVAHCFFGDIDPLAFADYQSEALVETATTIEITCTDGTSYSIDFDGGSNTASGGLRQMDNGAAGLLTYHLYNAPAAGTAEIAIDGDVGPRNGTGTDESIDISGRIDAGQDLVIGNYTDTVGLTVTWTP